MNIRSAKQISNLFTNHMLQKKLQKLLKYALQIMSLTVPKSTD